MSSKFPNAFAISQWESEGKEVYGIFFFFFFYSLFD